MSSWSFCISSLGPLINRVSNSNQANLGAAVRYQYSPSRYLWYRRPCSYRWRWIEEATLVVSLRASSPYAESFESSSKAYSVWGVGQYAHNSYLV